MDVYHLNLLIYPPEELLCAAATVISAISGSARCHRVHLTEPLLLFIFRKKLIAAIAISSSAKMRMKTRHTGLYGARCRVKGISQQHEYTTRMYIVTGLQASFQCHAWLEQALLVLSMQAWYYVHTCSMQQLYNANVYFLLILL